MLSAVSIANRIAACDPVSATEGITVLADTAITALTSDVTVYFRKGFFYGYKSFAAGVGTANTGAVNVGKSATYLPDIVNPGEAIWIEAPLGTKFRLADINFKGSAGDGLFYSVV